MINVHFHVFLGTIWYDEIVQTRDDVFVSGKKFPLQKGCTCESYKAEKQDCFIVKHVVGNSIL